MLLRSRAVVALAGLLVAGSVAGTAGTAGADGAAPATGPTTPRAAGAAGVGDPYFPQDGNAGIDVLHYDIRDRYSFGSGRLTGKTGLDVVATAPLSRFHLDFLLDVRSVRVDGKKVRFRQVGDHELRIRPARPIAAGSRFRVAVRYAGTPAQESSQGESNWLASADEVVTMNEPHMATWWFPANDHPSDKASYDIHITVPRGTDVVANGVLVGKRKQRGRVTAHWRAVEPMASYLAFFAAGSFETRTSNCGGVLNHVAVSRSAPGPGPGEAAGDLLARTCDVVSTFSQLLGPYPFTATGGVVTSLPVGFALENQTRPTYPGLPGATPALVAHEIAHQWFGDQVSVRQWRDIWVNEGFAQFLQMYYTLEVLQQRSAQTWLVDTYQAVGPDSPIWDVSISDPGADRLFDGAVYTRGAMALQALRHRLGDATFWALLRTWLAQRAYGNGSVAEFRALASSVSGQDLAGFFEAWLDRRVAPEQTAANGF